jgi:hypothetical protein
VASLCDLFVTRNVVRSPRGHGRGAHSKVILLVAASGYHIRGQVLYKFPQQNLNGHAAYLRFGVEFRIGRVRVISVGTLQLELWVKVQVETLCRDLSVLCRLVKFARAA